MPTYNYLITKQIIKLTNCLEFREVNVVRMTRKN